MQTLLIIVNSAPYGSERMLSALRLATALSGQEHETVDLRVFMMSDAVTVCLAGQCSGDASNDLKSMLEELVARDVQVRLCRTCAQTRGITDLALIPGIKIGTLPELSEWTLSADKVISF